MPQVSKVMVPPVPVFVYLNTVSLIMVRLQSPLQHMTNAIFNVHIPIMFSSSNENILSVSISSMRNMLNTKDSKVLDKFISCVSVLCICIHCIDRWAWRVRNDTQHSMNIAITPLEAFIERSKRVHSRP